MRKLDSIHFAVPLLLLGGCGSSFTIGGTSTGTTGASIGSSSGATSAASSTGATAGSGSLSSTSSGTGTASAAATAGTSGAGSGTSGSFCAAAGQDCALGAPVVCCSGLSCSRTTGLCVTTPADAGVTCGTNTCSSSETCIIDEQTQGGTPFPSYCVTTYGCENNTGCCFSPDLCSGICVVSQMLPQTLLCENAPGASSSSGGTTGGGGTFLCASPNPNGGSTTCNVGQFCELECNDGFPSCLAPPAGCDTCDCILDGGALCTNILGAQPVPPFCVDDGGFPEVFCSQSC